MRKKLSNATVALVAVVTILTGCATASAKSNEPIVEGTRGDTVGATREALIYEADQTNVDRATVFRALALYLLAMASEMLRPEPISSAPVVTQTKNTGQAQTQYSLHLPGQKEIYISGSLEPEVRWEVIRELRALGYQVSEDSSAPLHLQIEEKEERDPRYVTITYLVDRASKRIIAQGKGEVRLFLVTNEIRMKAKKQAAIAAVKSLR